MRPRLRDLLSRAALAVTPAILFTAGLLLRSVRGPWWLAFNSDPEYAYLFNSLLILKGEPPFHIDHPGVPLQMLGAAVIRVLHAGTPGGLDADVIARPEFFIDAIHTTALAVSVLLVFAAGLAVWRRETLGRALLLQCGPLVSVTVLLELGRARPEVLLIGMAAAFSAAALLWEAAGWSDARAAIVFGVITGVSVSLKLTALPLALGPLVLIGSRRWQRRYVLTAAGAFLTGVAVALVKLPSMGAWAARVALHSGGYGSGRATVIDPAIFLPGIAHLLANSPLMLLTIGISLATWVASRRETDADALRQRRLLGAMLIVQATQYVMAAKNPSPHYLVPAMATIGVNLGLVWMYWRRRAPASRMPAAVATALVLAAIPVQGVRLRNDVRALGAQRREAVSVAAATDAVAAADGCIRVFHYRSSSPAFALQFGNLWSRGGALKATLLQQRFPDVWFDSGSAGIRNFAWAPVDLAVAAPGRCLVMEGTTADWDSDLWRRAETVIAADSESIRRLRRR